MTHAKSLILLTTVILLTNASVGVAFGQINMSQNTPAVFSDLRKVLAPNTENVEPPCEAVTDGMMIEDLLFLQCFHSGLPVDPPSDLPADLCSTAITEAYTMYVVAGRLANLGIEDYIDLCAMFEDSRAGDSPHVGYLDHVKRKARREVTKLIEDAISSRANLAQLCSPEMVQIIDDRHNWTPIDDRKIVGPEPPVTKRVLAPEIDGTSFTVWNGKVRSCLIQSIVSGQI